MKTVIAEKYSVAKEIAGVIGAGASGKDYFSGNGYCVTWLHGHLLEMEAKGGGGAWKIKELPYIPESFVLKPIPEKPQEGRRERLDVVKELFDKCDSIVVATDAGREGELIFRNLYAYLKCNKPFRRLWISSLTEKAISEGFDNLYDGHDFDNLAKAAEQRAKADWYVGINATRAFTLIVNGEDDKGTVLSLGRVQTPTLCMICSRYSENKMFKPTPYWFLKGQSTKDGIPFGWRAVGRYEDEQEARRSYERVNLSGLVTVDEVTTERKNEMPPLLHDLASLQKAANARYGMAMEQTQSILQTIYEKKLVTYPRTGSRYIPEDVFATIPDLLQKLSGRTEYDAQIDAILKTGPNPRSVSDTKITDHHALLVTDKTPVSLTEEEQRVYDLVLIRVIEAFSPICVADVTKVALSCGEERFEARGRREVSLGWRGVAKTGDYEDVDLDDVDQVEMGQTPLPQLKKGDVLAISQLELVEDKTKPKPLLTDATLLTAMENAGRGSDDKAVATVLKDIGIGTPATRAEIMKTLIDRRYVERNGKKLVPTALGFAVYMSVKDKSIASVDTTASWEMALEKIADGEINAGQFEKRIIQYTGLVVENLIKSGGLEPVKKLVEENKVTCPKCGKPIRLLDKTAWCKDCGFTIWREIAGKRLNDVTLIKLIKNGETGLISGFKSKAGKEFSAYLKMDGEGKVSFEFEKRKETTLKCPKCGHDIVLTDKIAVCSSKECGFRIWREIAGKKLSETAIKSLIEKGVTAKIEGFKSKNGKVFSAALALEDDKVKFKFD